MAEPSAGCRQELFEPFGLKFYTKNYVTVQRIITTPPDLLPKIKTNYSKQSVMYRVMHVWNILPKH